MNEHYHHHDHQPVAGMERAARNGAQDSTAKQIEVGLEQSGTIYTCPMHPQIRRPAPGNCPICGMTLELVMPSLEDEKTPELEDFTRRSWWTLPFTIEGVALAMGGHRFVPVAASTTSWVEPELALNAAQ